MSAFGFSSFTRRQRILLAVAVAFPFLAHAFLRFTGLIGLATLGVFGAAGAVALSVVFARPRWGVYFMVFHVYSGLSFYIPGIVPMAVMAAIGLAVAIDLLRGGADRLTDGPFLAFIGLFVVLALQSILVAHNPQPSLVFMLTFVKAFSLLFMIVHIIRTPDQLHRLVFVIFVGTIATIAFGVINLKLGLYTTDNVIGGVQLYRFSGAHPNPNRAAAIMCSALPLGVFIARHTDGAWRRVLCYAGVIALVVGVFSTFSRSAVFPFSVVALAVVAREVRSRGGYASVLALLVLGILLTPQYYWDRLAGLSSPSTSMVNDFSVSMRFDAMRTAWALFLKHPWTGIGINAFIERGAIGLISRVVVHNTYLEILVGTGVFGFAAFMGAFCAPLRHALGGARRAWAHQNSMMRSMSFYVGLSALSIAVSGFFGSMPFIYAYWAPIAASLVLGNLIRSDT